MSGWPRAHRALSIVPGLALAYLAAGWLSLRIAIPPEYVSLVFVPAGIALIAALAWGRWALLGVGLGSLLLNLYSNWHAQGGLWSYNLLATPLGAVLPQSAGHPWAHPGFPGPGRTAGLPDQRQRFGAGADGHGHDRRPRGLVQLVDVVAG